MESKSKGKTVAIIILVLIILGLAGYIAYDKVIVKEKEEKKVTEKIEEKEINKEEIKEPEQISVEGYYKSGQVYSTDENPCDAENLTQEKGATIEILFNKDGSYIIKDAADCGGGYESTGTYTINDKKLTLKCDNSKTNCIGNGEYQINEFGTLSNSKNNLFAKVTKEQIQLFK